MIRDELLPPRKRCPPMNEMALRSKQSLGQDTFNAPDEELIPLRWSVPIWLVLAAGSWVAVIYVVSLFF